MLSGCAVPSDKLDLAIESLRAQVEPVTVSEIAAARSEIIAHLIDLTPAEVFAYRDSIRARVAHRCPGRH